MSETKIRTLVGASACLCVLCISWLAGIEFDHRGPEVASALVFALLVGLWAAACPALEKGGDL